MRLIRDKPTVTGLNKFAALLFRLVLGERSLVIMKKLLLVISSLLVTVGLCACGGNGGLFKSAATPTPIPVVEPSNLLSADEVKEYVNYDVTVDEESTEKTGAKSVVYVSNPKGKENSVTVKIIQFSDKLSKDDVWGQYDNGRIKRSSAKTVEGLGSDAYIAYPSIHVYDRGCEIIISAGSGSDQTQEDLLKRMAERAVMNFENIITSDADPAAVSGNVKQE